MCSGRVTSSCSASGALYVNERGKDREVLTTSGTYPWSFVTQTLLSSNNNKHCKSHVIYVFDIYFTEFGAALTTVLPVLFKYCYKYCYSDSRKL